MRKLVFTALITMLVHFIGIAQGSVADKQAAANEEMKKELVAKLKVAEDKAEKILAIENHFHTSIAATKTMAENSEAEKKLRRAKEHEAHVTRRAKLMELPLTGREMEDVIELSESIHRKNKL